MACGLDASGEAREAMSDKLSHRSTLQVKLGPFQLRTIREGIEKALNRELK
jgi:hypothetical protein